MHTSFSDLNSTTISTIRPPVPHSHVGWLKPITEGHSHDFTKILLEAREEINLRGYVAQEVD